MGAVAKSHKDLRLNFLQDIAKGITELVQENNTLSPTAGDFAVIEILPAVPLCRITFITDPRIKERFMPLCMEGAWGWVSPDIVPPWP